jgi:lantibiotic modifying enzyme
MILSHSATRRGLQENSVLDAGVCHGTAGIASIFNRLYLKTAREEFKEAAVYWCQETLSMAKFEDGFAGYKTWRTEKYGGWQTSTSLLEGVSGIGLCLLSFVTSDDPAWDECFLLS